MTRVLKYAFSLNLLFALLVSCSTGTTNTSISIDSITGIKKELTEENFGSGGGITGSLPHLTKQSIKKYDKSGNLIYRSNKNIERNGCLISTSKLDVIAYDPNGSFKTLKLEEALIITREFNKSKDLISEIKTDVTKFLNPTWVDEDDTF